MERNPGARAADLLRLLGLRLLRLPPGGLVDDAIVEEAKFATIGYLSNFVPPVLERKLKN